MLLGGNAVGQATTKIVNETSGDTSLFLEVRGVEDASVDAIPVERTSPNGKQLYCAYDINITKDGQEWQPEPEQPAIVSMEAPDFADGQLLDIYHEGTHGLEFVATVASENGKITFPAHSFSVYIVAAAPEYDRLKVNLHQADGTIVTIYVKKLDIERGDFKRIVYNPGFGTLGDGVQCHGWIDNRDYTKDDIPSALTFDDVRRIVTDRLNAGVEDGTEMDFYTMLFKSFSVLYLDENEAVINNDVLLFRADKNITSMQYRVNTNYTPRSNTSKFEGWMVNSPADGEHIVGHTDDSHNYTRETTIEITGNVTFDVVVSDGFWLIYHENGKGATYKAADFVHAGETTHAPELEMLRNGYTFVGWYTGEPATQYGDPTGSEFVFGSRLEANTHVYAKWKANETSRYTVIVWKQNVTCDGYDFEEAINLEGRPNTEINTVISSYENARNPNTRYAQINGVSKKYTGFYLNNFNEHVTIAPEGNSIVNVYYDRIEYTVKFIYYRMINSGRDEGKYQYATNKLTLNENRNATSNDYLCAKWTSSTYNNHPVCSYPRRDTVMGNYTYTYYPITARYGQSIVEMWPIYDNFDDFDNKRFSSWVLMIGAAARNDAVSGGGSVKGLISIMDEQILGDMTSSNGNYLVAKYSTADDWTYNIWFPKVTGEDYTERTCTTVNSVEYYLEYEILARSGSGASGQHQPSFLGFSNVSGNQRGNNNVMDYYYSRDKHIINYMDGSYYNGNNVKLNDYSPSGPLHEIEGVAYGSDMSSYGDYVHTAPRGFVFEGWYVDEPCTRPYNFNTKMPSANVTVYAKWRQIQYRVFLHPDVSDDDSTLFWGSDNQALNFRIDYGNKISVPTGIRDDYEFVGWYTDESLDGAFAFNENTVVLNDGNTVAYDKTTEFTDPMDKWGNGATWNSDVSYEDENTHEILPRNPERFWITKKYDLYGKWRAKLRGANGITVVYEDNAGTGPVPTEEFLYQDDVEVIAAPACSPINDTKVFSHWVLQTYNSSTGEYEDIPNSRIYPGTTFTALKADSKMVVTRWFDPNHPDNFIVEGFNPSSTTIHPISPDDPYVDYLATYTVKLRAEYEDVEKPEYTFMEWFMNNGEGTIARTDGRSGASPSLAINGAVDIPVPTREGYIFKGWYKENVSFGDPIPNSISDCTPNFLYYKNNKYYKENTYTNEVSQVAADRYMTYDYFYAIWEPDVKFTIEPGCMGVPISLPTTTNAGVDLSAGTWSWTASSGAVSGTTYTATEKANVTLTFNPDPSTCAQAKDFNISFTTPNVDNPSSYDYIWRSGTTSRLTDWNTASNWYVYNNGYSVATELPSTGSNIYIGPSECVTPTWPQANEANAKNITIAENATLTVPADMTLKIAGNLDNIGTLDATEGTVAFCGTADQTISHDITFGMVTFSSEGNIVPSGSVAINKKANFNNGILVGDVTFNIGAEADVTNYNSFVSGTVTKLVGEIAEDDFTFPTGSNGVDQPNVLGSVYIKKLPINSTTAVTFHQKSNEGGFGLDVLPRWWNVADNCSGNNPKFDHVSNFEYWNVNTSTTLVDATLTLSAEDVNAHFGNTSNYDEENIFGAMWMGSCWQNLGGPASFAGATITISVDSIPAVSHRNTEPSYLTIGSKDQSTLLPIELLSFTATCDGRTPIVEWATATERNNDYFVIERSDDAINFVEVARVAGAGNSIEQQNYSYTDYTAASGDNYYRLVQVDYDGSRTVSEIVSVACDDNADGTPEIMAYPNPFCNELTLDLNNFGNRTAHIEVYDMLGKMVMQDKVDAPQNSYEMILNFGNLPAASYTIRVSTVDFVINKQVVKKNL
jgi:uncharacterized repeat protein (TIGR02543 family)